MSQTAPPLSRAWLVVGLLWFVVCFNYIAGLMLTTMHGSILASLPMSETQFGLLTSSALWTFGLTSAVAGFASDRFGRSRVIVASLLVWSSLTIGCAYAGSFLQLLALRGLMGAAEAFYMPSALALISEYHPGSTRSLATGVHQTGICAGIGLAGLGGWLAEMRTWHFAFAVVGVAGIAYAGLLAALLRDVPSPEAAGDGLGGAAAPARFGQALACLFGRRSRRPFGLALANFSLIGLTSWTVISWMPVFFHEHFHLAQGTAGFSANFYASAAMVPGMLIGGAWADRWSRTNRRARMLVPAFGLLLAAPCILLTATTSLLLAGIIGIVCYRMFSVFTDSNMMPILCEIVDSRYRATAYGLLNLTGTTVAGLGVFLTGTIRDSRIDLAVIFGGIGAITALSAPLFFMIRPRAGEERASGRASTLTP